MAVIVLFLMCVLSIWALLDLYMLYRYWRKDGVDKTSAGFTWLATKWVMATQGHIVAKKLGYPGKDLSEILGLRDDGKVT